MFNYLKAGWSAAAKQPFVLLVLFVYRLAWGMLLYGLIQSVVVPLLHRYPLSDGSGGQEQLFYAEAQFRLLKTDLIHPYLWLLLALIGVRMLLTPLFNAGIYFSLHQTHLNAGYRFFKGMRELGRPFAGYYLAQTALILAPLYWLLPHWGEMLYSGGHPQAAFIAALPGLLAYFLFASCVQIGFIYLQLGRAQSRSWAQSLGIAARSLPPVAGIWLLLLLAAVTLALFATAAVWIWASFWAIVLYQAYRFIVTFVNLWSITAQYKLFSAKV